MYNSGEANMLKIFKDSDKVLRTRAEEVSLPLSEENTLLAHQMLEHIKQSQDEEFAAKHKLRAGVGLAAPQVGESKRIIVVNFPVDEENEVCYVLANPKIISSSVRRIYLNAGEGCLSVDEDYTGHVYRFAKVRVRAYDILAQKEIEINASGYEAIVLQHEIDHLNGVLFYDRINSENKTKYPDAIVI